MPPRFDVTVLEFSVLQEIDGVRAPADYAALLKRMDFGDTSAIAESELRDMCRMSLQDLEPDEAAAVVLTHDLAGAPRPGQITQMSHTICDEKLWEDSPEMELHERHRVAHDQREVEVALDHLVGAAIADPVHDLVVRARRRDDDVVAHRDEALGEDHERCLRASHEAFIDVTSRERVGEAEEDADPRPVEVADGTPGERAAPDSEPRGLQSRVPGCPAPACPVCSLQARGRRRRCRAGKCADGDSPPRAKRRWPAGSAV